MRPSRRIHQVCESAEAVAPVHIGYDAYECETFTCSFGHLCSRAASVDELSPEDLTHRARRLRLAFGSLERAHTPSSSWWASSTCMASTPASWCALLRALRGRGFIGWRIRRGAARAKRGGKAAMEPSQGFFACMWEFTPLPPCLESETVRRK